ncbi:tubulin-like doman-containing protein [Arthrobacter sp.]|uniref:tubulin-like doman-containing protein n=1 Tax=Arthrobacter sp. TaxID=1667 RepID=UPI0026E00E37|nr:tubulin-like doman-containing protein [Arthrobacter sp.]MDO5752289.1 tubulin-like doman-containing protein [Arthrobacter sp.]
MRKFLVVGCGGSGGATLAFMMDQLKSELAAHGVDSIPAGWQFVQIDVPTAPDFKNDGVGNVFQQGGSYIATGPQSGSYSILDNALSQTLNSASALGQIGTWAPRKPEQINTPIHSGAGQLRAVGRMITLSKANEVRSGLERAFQRLNLVETNTEMASLKVPGMGDFHQSEPPMVLVVSSMAGGAGASMALDVCRLLALVPGVTPSMIGVFMVAADAFDGLPPAARGGVRANALAMLGEIVAAQTKAAADHDTATLAALGQKNGMANALPFARVFPVGRFAGVSRTMFGDGSQDALYRGLGRGLAALMLSGKASADFISYDLTNNSTDKPARRDTFGWGATSEDLAWGAFGFASLSMGRDRYGEYAAQRMARTAVDRLRLGHMQPNNSATGIEQVNALADSQWSNICRALELPVPHGSNINQTDVLNWFNASAFTRDDAGRIANAITDEQVVPYIPEASGVAANQWIGGLRQRLQERRASLTNVSVEAAYQWGYGYKDELLSRFITVVEDSVTQFGLPYARVVVDRIEALIKEQLLNALGGIVSYGVPAVATVPPQFEGEIAPMKVIANGQAVVDRLVGLLRGQTSGLLYLQVGKTMSTVLTAFVNDVVAPMREALSESLTLLDQSQAARPTAVGLANVATDQYAAWPSDENLSVPARFDVADNEILITESKTFATQYENDVTEVGSAGTNHQGFNEGRWLIVGQTIRGLWSVAGGDIAPGGLLEQTRNWQPAEFNRDPFTGKPLTPSRAAFTVHVTPQDLVGRARRFVARKNEAFDNFCSLSLREYVRGTDAKASEVPQRQADVIAKFNETLNRAVPLISVNRDVVQQLHSDDVKYRFKFSSVPFGELDDVAGALFAQIAGNDDIAEETAAILQQAMTSEDKVQKIDIFGSYRNYSPLVFDSVLAPVAQQWAGTSLPERKGFWSQRRARPLAASLPMGQEERRALVAGWFVGQITGRLRLPEPPYTSAVEVWDEENGYWAQFPNPLLTPPSQFLAKSYDWLPAVLESILLAVANTHQSPVLSSMRPYNLLRSFYDSSPEEPASGLFETAAVEELAQWLATGRTQSGMSGRVPGVVAASSIDERYESTKNWLESIRALAGDHFMEPEYLGAKGGGSFSKIQNRKTAGSTPLFRDIAPDIFVTLGELLGHLGTARQRALTGGGQESPDSLDLPDLGAF